MMNKTGGVQVSIPATIIATVDPDTEKVATVKIMLHTLAGSDLRVYDAGGYDEATAARCLKAAEWDTWPPLHELPDGLTWEG